MTTTKKYIVQVEDHGRDHHLVENHRSAGTVQNQSHRRPDRV
jgi:hypothetical protein